MIASTELIDQFLERARKSGMIDALRSAAMVIGIDPSHPDLQMALQIGMALLYEKPLLLVLLPGDTIPQRLRDLADEIVEMDKGGPNNPVNGARVTAAVTRITDKIKQQERRNDERSRA